MPPTAALLEEAVIGIRPRSLTGFFPQFAATEGI